MRKVADLLIDVARTFWAVAGILAAFAVTVGLALLLVAALLPSSSLAAAIAPLGLTVAALIVALAYATRK